MAGIGLFRIFDPKVRRHLISDEGEVVIDEVRHHWVVFVVPMLEIVLAGALLATMVLTKVGASVMASAQAVTTTGTRAAAAAQTSSRPSPPPSGSATKSIFNSDRGNWIDNE